jgi:hypothetical protein
MLCVCVCVCLCVCVCVHIYCSQVRGAQNSKGDQAAGEECAACQA